MRRKVGILLGGLAALAVTAMPPAHAANGSVSIVDYNFQPSSVTINVGESVTWTNHGPSTHTATGPGFDSMNLTTGQSYTHTFSQAGTFNYQCKIHSIMTGSVTVVGSAPPPPPPPAPGPAPAPSPQPAPGAAPAPAAAPKATTPPPTTAAPTTTTSSSSTTIAPPAAADAGTTSSTLAAAGGGVALPAQKTSSGDGGDSVSPWLIALAIVLVLGAGAGGLVLRRRAV